MQQKWILITEPFQYDSKCTFSPPMVFKSWASGSNSSANISQSMTWQLMRIVFRETCTLNESIYHRFPVSDNKWQETERNSTWCMQFLTYEYYPKVQRSENTWKNRLVISRDLPRSSFISTLSSFSPVVIDKCFPQMMRSLPLPRLRELGSKKKVKLFWTFSHFMFVYDLQR